METVSEEKRWRERLKDELPRVAQLLTTHGFLLDDEQPHVMGERFLMQALTTTSGKKLILLGCTTKSRERVVIKVTNDAHGKSELLHERACRTMLHQMRFAYDTFHSPRELLFAEEGEYLIAVYEYITQERSFLERPLVEQFTFALDALKKQERTRATTAGHLRSIKRVFGERTSTEYLRLYGTFHTQLSSAPVPSETLSLHTRALDHLIKHRERIEQYCGFLTHIDFVPHNFRIRNNTLYLLDFSSLRFGNKHEGWARFLNFMTLYNRPLEEWLIAYVEHNRSFEERESLQLLRIFRLGEIIAYYARAVMRSTDDLERLNRARIDFWTGVLAAELENRRVADTIVHAYQKTRDALRSPEEKVRQIGLH